VFERSVFFWSGRVFKRMKAQVQGGIPKAEQDIDFVKLEQEAVLYGGDYGLKIQCTVVPRCPVISGR
jgi:hypothetical protein